MNDEIKNDEVLSETAPAPETESSVKGANAEKKPTAAKKTKKSGHGGQVAEIIQDIVRPLSRGRSKKAAGEAPTPVAPRMLAAIVERGKSVRFREILQKNGIFLSEVFMGNGTASSDILDILGLESTEKDVVISITDAEKAHSMMSKLSDQLAGSVGSKGIAFCMRLRRRSGSHGEKGRSSRRHAATRAASLQRGLGQFFQRKLLVRARRGGYSRAQGQARRHHGSA